MYFVKYIIQNIIHKNVLCKIVLIILGNTYIIVRDTYKIK